MNPGYAKICGLMHASVSLLQMAKQWVLQRHFLWRLPRSPFAIVRAMDARSFLALLALLGCGSALAQQPPGQPGSLPVPAGPVAGTPPATPPSSREAGPVGAP